MTNNYVEVPEPSADRQQGGKVAEREPLAGKPHLMLTHLSYTNLFLLLS